MIRTAWFINAILFVACAAWLVVDPRARTDLEMLAANPWQSMQTGHGIAVVLGGVVAALSVVAIGAGLLRGSKHDRSLRRWFAFVALVALWLAMGGAWRQVHWRGQVARISRAVAELEPIAERLGKDWPTGDGALDGLGSFTAYPLDRPSSLLILGRQPIPGLALSVVAVDRTDDGALRFQLGGSEEGGCLERRPSETAPTEFVDGLMGRRRVESSTSLGNGWYAVRYVVQ